MLRMPKLEFTVQWDEQTSKQTNFKLVLVGRERDRAQRGRRRLQEEGDAGVYLKICYATSDFSSCKFIADLMKQREEALRQEC